ncbi:hypothetical protein MesoLj131b_28270 [Mesorhizobium sp. 131-2-5]|nr:hypothetical protein MesoLj131b_28270 [Mesorhizobium sp. 131-2-5]
MVSARSRGSDEVDFIESEKATTGGAALTEISEDTVIATGLSPGSAVITATPAGWRRKASRKALVIGCGKLIDVSQLHFEKEAGRRPPPGPSDYFFSIRS